MQAEFAYDGTLGVVAAELWTHLSFREFYVGIDTIKTHEGEDFG